MDNLSFIIATISAVIALGATFASFLVWKTAKRTLANQAIRDILDNYSSPQMLAAIQKLWDLYRKQRAKGQEGIEERIKNEYQRIWNKDKERYKALDFKDKLPFLETTIHYQRRIVSNFYLNMAAIYENKILPKKYIFTLWREKDLRIIPNIIIPITKGVTEITQQEPDSQETNMQALQKLYEGAKNFRKTRRCIKRFLGRAFRAVINAVRGLDPC